jgi:PDZ domain-containing protein
VFRRRAVLGIVAGAVLAAAVFAVLLTVPSDDYLILPDRARPTDQLVEVPGEHPGSGKAGIYMVDVTVGRANLFERIFHRWLFDGESLLPARVINPEGVSDTQRRQSSLNQMSQSQLIAITVALRSLGKTVEVRPVGAEVVLVQPGAPADGKLQVGDVVVEAEGQPVRTTDDLARAASGLTPGDDLTLTVERGDKRIDFTLPTRESESEPGRAVVGIGVQNAQDYDFPIDVKIDAGSIGGPSAGLAFALDVANELGPDLVRDRVIVATGELTLDGKVLPIGGVKQKAIAAERAGADLFLVPDGNAAEARAAVDNLKIVPVSTFDEAVAALEER